MKTKTKWYIIIIILVMGGFGAVLEQVEKSKIISGPQPSVSSDNSKAQDLVPKEEIEYENKTSKVENMSLDEKKRIYAEYIYAQRAAGEETLKLFPPKKQMENMAAYLKYDSENREKHYREVAKKNNLLRDELTTIVMQANSEMWEMPNSK